MLQLSKEVTVRSKQVKFKTSFSIDTHIEDIFFEDIYMAGPGRIQAIVIKGVQYRISRCLAIILIDDKVNNAHCKDFYMAGPRRNQANVFKI